MHATNFEFTKTHLCHITKLACVSLNLAIYLVFHLLLTHSAQKQGKVLVVQWTASQLTAHKSVNLSVRNKYPQSTSYQVGMYDFCFTWPYGVSVFFGAADGLRTAFERRIRRDHNSCRLCGHTGCTMWSDVQGILILGGVLGFVVSGSVKSLSACCDLTCDPSGPRIRNSHT